MPPFFANPIHKALTTANAQYAVTNGPATRYQPDIIPFGGVDTLTPESFAALRDLLDPGESLFFIADHGQALPEVPGMEHAGALPGIQMYFTGTTPEPEPPGGPEILSLTKADLPEMLALKAVAFPGYFHERAPVLGSFFGIRVEGELVAMAGERLSLPEVTEVSAVCTHPDHLGKGYAAALIRTVLRAQAARSVSSMLHTSEDNTRAIALYERLGFVTTGKFIFHSIRRAA